MNKDTGGPAFPCTEANYADPKWSFEGMTLRDYFAAKAMQAFWNDEALHPSVTKQNAAEWAYSMADAMLEARSKS
jgi:hypothetical protein